LRLSRALLARGVSDALGLYGCRHKKDQD